MHAEALTDIGTRLFPQLARFKGFYLVGGTALALQIGHRQSVDFDMFTPERLPDQLFQTIKRVFKTSSVFVTYRVPGQINLKVAGVKMTFFQYEYPVIEPYVEDQGVLMASIKEIAAMKAFSIGKRLSYKDYIDWYFILKEKHVELKEVIALAEKKYGGDFNDRLFLSQLASVHDIRLSKIDFIRDEVDQKTVQSFLEESVRNFPL